MNNMFQLPQTQAPTQQPQAPAPAPEQGAMVPYGQPQPPAQQQPPAPAQAPQGYITPPQGYPPQQQQQGYAQQPQQQQQEAPAVDQSFWDGMSDADAGGRKATAKLKAGNYKLQIKSVFTFKTRKHGAAFIAEMTVLESDHPEFPIGKTVSFFQLLTNQDVAHREIKRFVVAVLGLDMTQEQNKQWVKDNVDANPRDFMARVLGGALNNMTVGCTVSPEWSKPTDKNPVSKEYHNAYYEPWKPYEGWQPAPVPDQPAVPQTSGPCPHGQPQPMQPAGYVAQPPQPQMYAPQPMVGGYPMAPGAPMAPAPGMAPQPMLPPAAAPGYPQQPAQGQQPPPAPGQPPAPGMTPWPNQG